MAIESFFNVSFQIWIPSVRQPLVSQLPILIITQFEATRPEHVVTTFCVIGLWIKQKLLIVRNKEAFDLRVVKALELPGQYLTPDKTYHVELLAD